MASQPVYAMELLPDCVAELMALAPSHRAEVSAFPARGAPDMDAYLAMHCANFLRVFTMRDATITDFWPVVGYCIMIVRRHVHDESIRANDDTLYVTPEYRGYGYEFISWIDKQLAYEGVEYVSRTCKVDHSYGDVLKRKGYVPVDVVYTRELRALKEPVHG